MLKAGARAARGRLDAVQATLEDAEINLSHTTVTAPFDGTVSETFAENFQNVVAKERILRLLDTAQIEMEVHVPEALIGLAPNVSKILVQFKTLPGPGNEGLILPHTERVRISSERALPN